MGLVEQKVLDASKVAPVPVCPRCVEEGMQVDVRDGSTPFYEILCMWHLLMSRFRKVDAVSKTS